MHHHQQHTRADKRGNQSKQPRIPKLVWSQTGQPCCAQRQPKCGHEPQRDHGPEGGQGQMSEVEEVGMHADVSLSPEGAA